MLLVSQDARTKHAYGNAREFRRLQGKRTEVNPRLRTHLFTAGAYTGDKHRNEQNNRKAHDPRHALAQSMWRNLQAQPKGKETKKHHDALP